MATCVPIKNLRDTAAFLELVRTSPEPITVTKNGYDEFVAIRSDDYADMRRAESYYKLMARMAVAEQESVRGLGRDAFEALEDLGARHGL